MSINADKTKVVCFRKNPDFTPLYTPLLLDDQPLLEVLHCKYLGCVCVHQF